MDSEIIFNPYVGKEYKNIEFKILVLGESHYLDDSEKFKSFENNKGSYKNFTMNIVNDFLSYKKGEQPHKKWMNTFTKFGNTLKNSNLNSVQTSKLWNELAFYNYVQVPMPAPRVEPKISDFSKSYNAFNIVLETLKPDVVLFWGFRFWNNFPKDENCDKMYFDSDRIDIIKGNPNISFKILPHPSTSSFKRSLHQEIIDYFEITKKYKMKYQ